MSGCSIKLFFNFVNGIYLMLECNLFNFCCVEGLGIWDYKFFFEWFFVLFNYDYIFFIFVLLLIFCFLVGDVILFVVVFLGVGVFFVFRGGKVLVFFCFLVVVLFFFLFVVGVLIGVFFLFILVVFLVLLGWIFLNFFLVFILFLVGFVFYVVKIYLLVFLCFVIRGCVFMGNICYFLVWLVCMFMFWSKVGFNGNCLFFF